jgi:hypothetical protein
VKLTPVAPPQNFNIVVGDTVSDGVPATGAGNIEGPGSADIYTFTAFSGQSVNFEGLNTGTTCGPRWILRDALSAVIFDAPICSDPGFFVLDGTRSA